MGVKSLGGRPLRGNKPARLEKVGGEPVSHPRQRSIKKRVVGHSFSSDEREITFFLTTIRERSGL